MSVVLPFIEMDKSFLQSTLFKYSITLIYNKELKLSVWAVLYGHIFQTLCDAFSANVMVMRKLTVMDPLSMHAAQKLATTVLIVKKQSAV